MRWNVRTAEPADLNRLQEVPNLLPSVARLLVLRGIRDPQSAERFLNPSLAHLHSPYLMRGMSAAVERLCAAIGRQEKILIYGDYDADGTMAVVVLMTAIGMCGGTADFHVPHRIRDGYGMKDEVIEQAAAQGVRLIISVDTGIRAFAAADAARRSGVDLIVTDHHLPQSEGVPDAVAVLNPNQPGCDYPCKFLCGAGVAFKLCQALLEKSQPERTDMPRLLASFMKVVAIATIADAVPLTGENRVFAKLGLDGLRAPKNAGLQALLDSAQLGYGEKAGARKFTAGDVAFRLAPRLNAAGRMDVAQTVIELFMAKDVARTRELAERLNQLNADRQEEERRIMSAIEARIEESPELRDAYCMVVDGDGWHRGVVGITATRVVERYNRPALVITRDGEEAHGSGRSIAAFHLLNALQSCPKLFTRFGGHAHAVGFALPSDRIPELRASVDAYARTQLTAADFEPILRIDGELTLDQVTAELFNAVKQLDPFGMGNPEPVFAVRNARLLLPPRLLKEAHVKLKLAPAQKTGKFVPGFEAVGWRMAERLAQQQLLAGDTVDVAFTLDHNDHPEFGGLQLCLNDFVKTTVSVSASAT